MFLIHSGGIIIKIINFFFIKQLGNQTNTANKV